MNFPVMGLKEYGLALSIIPLQLVSPILIFSIIPFFPSNDPPVGSCWVHCLILYAKVDVGFGVQNWQFLKPPASCWRTFLLLIGLNLPVARLVCKIVWRNKWEGNKFLSAYEEIINPARLSHINIACGKEVVSFCYNLKPYIRTWGKISPV